MTTEFGKEVRKARAVANVTLGDMAFDINEQVTDCSAYEVGRKLPSAEYVNKCVRYFRGLGVDAMKIGPSYLATREEHYKYNSTDIDEKWVIWDKHTREARVRILDEAPPVNEISFRMGVDVEVTCPACTGNLHGIVHYNGHVHAQCETKDCLSWIE